MDLVSSLLDETGNSRSALLQVLHAVQRHHGSVPAEAISILSQHLHIGEASIHGVIGFYSFLHERSRGRYDVLFSDNVTDRMLGSETLQQQLCELLGVSMGVPSADGTVCVSTTSCTGMCDQGPALLVNGVAIAALDTQRIEQLAGLINDQVPLSAWPSDLFDIHDNIRVQGPMLENRVPRGGVIEAWQQHGSDSLLEILSASGLRGRGGAGFDTASKWRMCRAAVDGGEHGSGVVVCNADEGEPGTFKDRVLLNSYAEDVIEGMTLCAVLVGASEGYIYLRSEYEYLRGHIEAILQQRREQGLLGERIMGADDFGFDITIHIGAGAYICGEESALIESLEGHRGIPRIRPPYPVTAGYLGRPTVVNNVETFKAAAHIAVMGAEWYGQSGTQDSAGSKLLSISGDCERPGIYEFPFGVSIRDVLQACGGESAQAVQVSGAAGTTIPASSFDRRIAFEDVATGGSFMVFGEQRDMLDIVQNFVHFFAHESCGLCTPCRVGTSLQRDLIDKIREGRGSSYDIEQLRSIADVMRSASHCGLGATAASPVLDMLAHFPAAFETRLAGDVATPAFDLDAALSDARVLTGRDDDSAHIRGDE